MKQEFIKRALLSLLKVIALTCTIDKVSRLPRVTTGYVFAMPRDDESALTYIHTYIHTYILYKRTYICAYIQYM